LIGGSIALAALRAGYRVYLYDRLAAKKLVGAKFGSAVIVDHLEELASHSQLIILATPIAALAGIGVILGELVRSGHVVSDVASVKEPVTKALAKALRNRCDYVPAHPMAGSENLVQRLREAIYLPARLLWCARSSPKTRQYSTVKAFWEELERESSATTSPRCTTRWLPQ
jgi:prephenate dehydrogenase